jgi:phosphoribosylanthranilate isomerase
MAKLHLKICGIIPGQTDREVEQMADYLGFIFYERSDRFVGSDKNEKIKSMRGMKKVGVFVNESAERILSLIELTQLTTVQLHGDESPSFCAKIKTQAEVIKAFPIAKEADLEAVEKYAGVVDFFLFDTKGSQRGGNGIKFNWDLLKDKRFAHPFFLSGGISREDAAIIKEYEHPDLAGIDINSCFEIDPGTKDIGLISAFKNELYD